MAITTNQSAIDSLSEDWHRCGVGSGDLLLLHSSTARTLRRMKKRKLDASVETILDSFLATLGGQGTLLLPLFNFDFSNGIPFDLRSTPSQMGALTEVARMRPGVVRTGHPVYSFAALGSRQALFRGVDNFSGYGADSPFAILHKEGGKIAVLDLPDQKSMTFYHYVEEAKSIDYRFHKRFSGKYTDLSGESQERTYGLFVRRLDLGIVTHVDPMAELLWEKSLYAGDRPGCGAGLRVIDSRNLFHEVAAVIDQGRARGMLYEIQPVQ